MGQDDVSDTGKKKTLSLGGGEPLSLRKPGEGGGAPSRGGMGGGRKTVKVEVRRRRAPARGAQAGAGEAAAKPSGKEESPAVAASAQASTAESTDAPKAEAPAKAAALHIDCCQL